MNKKIADLSTVDVSNNSFSSVRSGVRLYASKPDPVEFVLVQSSSVFTPVPQCFMKALNG